MVAQDRLQRQFRSKRTAGLHLDEDRRFLQPATHPDREEAENAADEKRNAPCAIGDRFRREDRVDYGCNGRAEQNAE
ncbi:hypothetical protein D3C87_1701170 [compost metagenome]